MWASPESIFTLATAMVLELSLMEPTPVDIKCRRRFVEPQVEPPRSAAAEWSRERERK